MNIKYKVLNFDAENGAIGVLYYIKSEADGQRINIALDFSKDNAPTVKEIQNTIKACASSMARDYVVKSNLKKVDHSHIKKMIGEEGTFNVDLVCGQLPSATDIGTEL